LRRTLNVLLDAVLSGKENLVDHVECRLGLVIANVTLRAELFEKYDTALKVRRLLRVYSDDGHLIVFTVTNIMGRWTKMGQHVTLLPFFALDKLRKRYV
jgi:hypothetical protein